MTPLTGAIHGLLAAALASMAMSVTQAKMAKPAEPVVLTKGGYVIYDSQTRAEIIGKLLNITPENENAFLKWGFK
jgi:hypothetical protein